MLNSDSTRFAIQSATKISVIVPVAKTGKATHVYWIFSKRLCLATTQNPNKRRLHYGKLAGLLM